MTLVNVEPFATYIRPDQAAWLVAESVRTRVPRTVPVRQALDLFAAVQRYPRSWQSTRVGVVPLRRRAAP